MAIDENFLYASLLFLVGVISLKLRKEERVDWKDPYLVRISLLVIGIFSVLISIYLFIKSIG